MSDIDSDDSDLRRAIALSLEETHANEKMNMGSPDLICDDGNSNFDKKNATSFQLARNDEDEDVKYQINLKGTKGFTEPAVKPAKSEQLLDLRAGAPRLPPGLSSVLGLDRKKMEEERLNRTKKRKASSPPPRPQGPIQQQATYLMNDSGHSIQKRPRKLTDSGPSTLQGLSKLTDDTHIKLPSDVQGDSQRPDVLSYRKQETMLATGIQFPEGIVKKTWVYGCPRICDIKIEEILQKDDLDLAVLSSFQWDEEWVLSKLNLRKTKVICVMQAEREEQKAEIHRNAPPNIRFCFPSMAGQINCMHSKLQLLSHPTHLRIVVPSANLVPYDWGESGGVMENTVFIIDLPRIPTTLKSSSGISTPFYRELRRFLQAMGIESSVLDSLSNFDFSRTARFAFIHSIGGSHSGTDWKQTGFCGLGSSIKELGLSSQGPLRVDYVNSTYESQTASLGALNEDFIESIYLAAKGNDGYLKSSSPSRRPPSENSTQHKEDRQIWKEVKKHFCIYFPSRETVESSKGGTGAGGTICFQSKWYNAQSFPRSLMRNCHSERRGILMHNKMLFARLATPVPVPDNCSKSNMLFAAWAYVGSANLSESAWGRLVRDKVTKMPKLNCRNWECGVVVPVIIPEDSGRAPANLVNYIKGEEPTQFPNMDIFQSVVPVPMLFPGAEYGTEKPWFYREH